MKYEAEIDLRKENTSHALLVELVGRDKRVLDVGCASGYLGTMLKRRGCRVSGVEVDSTAAQEAEQVLDDVLIGDVGALDLVEHFGKESFDVVVFGDVLEHLTDPVSVLRRVRPLLADSGSVVASIPNVAHGSVRLSLLKGQFEYQELGLLDSTHLRFFTRGSVHETFREAGLLPVDMRRTTAGVFDTEIGVRREDFDPGIVDAVEGDPDSTTYQFVVRAVPTDCPDAGGVQAPRSGLARTADCRIGIWASVEPDDIGHALTLRVTHAELSRRLPGATVRAFSSSEGVRPSPHTGGIPVEALGTWSAERASALAAELDCVVVAGALPEPAEAEIDGGRSPARFLLEGLGQQAELECAVIWSAVRLPETPLTALGRAVATPSYRAVLDVSPMRPPAHAVDDEPTIAVPDPLLLVPRLLRAEALARRLEFVRIMGWFPSGGTAVVVEMGGGLLAHAEEVARALGVAVGDSDASVVLVQIQPDDADGNRAADVVAGAMATPVYRIPGDALVDDVVAVIANAAAFAPCSASGAALGLAYERAMAYVDFAGESAVSHLASITGGLGAVVTRPDELTELLVGERFRPTAGVAAKLQCKLDAHFDRITTIAEAAAAARPRTRSGRAVLPPSEYMAAVELAHHRMQERLDAERQAVATHLRDLRTLHGADLLALRAEQESTEAKLRSRLDKATLELEALRGIRVLRLLRPARAAYARLRGHRL